MRKGTLEEYGFPALNGLDGCALRRARRSQTYSPVVAARIPIGSRFEGRISLRPSVLLKRPHKKLSPADFEDQRRMREGKAIELSRLFIRFPKEHDSARRRTPPDNHLWSPRQDVFRQKLGSDLAPK